MSEEGSPTAPVVGEVVSSPAEKPEAVVSTALVPASAEELTLDELAQMGFVTPIADPKTIRAATLYRQKVIAALLDPNHDFLYTVSYNEPGKGQREYITSVLADAQKFEKAYNSKLRANVKKSGVQKLCAGLGLEGRKVEHLGYPTDPKAEWTQITYEVKHRQSGRIEQGVGLASLDERPGRAFPKHHLVSLADTRAHSRAVLRLAGLGEVGAEEVLTVHSDEPEVRITAGAPTAALPASTGSVLDVTKGAVARVERMEREKVAAAPTSTPAPQVQSTPVPAPQESAPEPAPTPTPTPIRGDEATITDAQAAKLSQLAKQKLGTVDRVKTWLTENAKVESSRMVRERDYPALLKKLEAMEVP